MKNITLSFCILFLSLLAQSALSEQIPDWVDSMRTVHAGFDGEKGYVSQFGDSITYSMAFWSPMSWSDPSEYLSDNDGLPLKPNGKEWRDVILGVRDKGPENGNFSGWTSGQVLVAVEKYLAKRKPETAIILVGSNDIRWGRVPADYRENLEEIVKACLAVHCIPILNTIPPFRGKDAQVEEVNRIIQEVANSYKVPLVDYHAACLRYRPGKSWDGTLISQDGVHPSAGNNHDYSDENLKNSGYALRNWVNFLVYREVYFRVLNPQAGR